MKLTFGDRLALIAFMALVLGLRALNIACSTYGGSNDDTVLSIIAVAFVIGALIVLFAKSD